MQNEKNELIFQICLLLVKYITNLHAKRLGFYDRKA